jgi:hypothetical protein
MRKVCALRTLLPLEEKHHGALHGCCYCLVLVQPVLLSIVPLLLLLLLLTAAHPCRVLAAVRWVVVEAVGSQVASSTQLCRGAGLADAELHLTLHRNAKLLVQ